MPGSPIRSIRLRRFRGFEHGTLRLKRLTVLLGPNSAGKSSFGQALAALKQTNASEDGEPDLGSSGAGRLVDLGAYDDVAHQGSRDGVGIDIELEPGGRWIELTFGGVDESGKMQDLRPTLLKLPNDRSSIPQQAGGSRMATVNVQMEIPQITGELSTTTPIGVGVDEFIRATQRQWRGRLNAQTEGDLTTLVFKGLKLVAANHAASGSIVPFPKTSLNLFTRALTTVQYLKPSRLQPQRRYKSDPNKRDELGPSGEWTPAFLHKHRSDPISTLIPPECPKTPAEAADLLATGHPWTTKRDTLVNSLGSWVHRLGLGNSVRSTEKEGDFRLDIDATGAEHSFALPDIGFGVSQVLPVLVAGLMLDPEGLLIVEQPEAQLHPRPQAALADFFCSVAKSGRASLVETHSEAFFHRLRLRAAMDPDLAENIVVYFLHEPDARGICGEPAEVRLDDDGVVDWPIGFLTDGIEEELSISAVRAAKSAKAVK